MKEKENFKGNKIILYLFIFFTVVVGIFAFFRVSANSSLGADNQNINLKVNLDKYINYTTTQEDNGTLIQYDVKAGMQYQSLEDQYIPLKQSQIKLEFNKIDEKYPYAVKVISKSTKMTNGKTEDIVDNYAYDSNQGLITINASNQGENGELINSEKPNGEANDEYIVIAYYDTYSQTNENRELGLKVQVVAMMNEDDRLITHEEEFKGNANENIGELTSISKITEDIYNSYIKSNIINNTEYGTQYTELENIVVSKKEAQENLKLEETNTFIRINKNENEEEIETNLGNNGQLIYKSTKVNRKDIEKLLGEEGKIEILDDAGNVISTIDKNTEYSENGFFTVNYENGIEKFIIKTSEIKNEGILRIEHKKEIKNTMKEAVDTKIKTISKLIGTKQETVEEQAVEKETFNNEHKNIIDIKDTTSNVKLELSKQNWTNKEQNEVTFNVYINSNTLKDNMLKNPSVRIELPDQVEKVLLQNSSVAYANGLQLQNPYLETNEQGKISIIANLQGIQTNYDANQLGLVTNIRIPATVILKKDIENASGKVNMIYTNNFTLDGNPETITNAYDLEISSYEKEVPVEQENIAETSDKTQISEVEGLKLEVVPVKGDTVLKDGDVVYEGEFIKYNIKVTNTSDKQIDNIKIVGSIPEGTTYGELEADYHNPPAKDEKGYEYKYNEEITQKEISINSLEAGKSYEVFYEVKVEDLDDNVTSKDTSSNIKILVNNIQAINYNISNIIENADIKVFLMTYPYRIEGVYLGELNINSNIEEEVTLRIPFPKEFLVSDIMNKEGYEGEEDPFRHLENVINDNIVNVKVKLKKGDNNYYIQGNIDALKTENQTEDSKLTLKTVATVTLADGTSYKSNENRIEYDYENIAVSMESKNEGEEVKYQDEIIYEININNIGNKNSNDEIATVTTINLKDYLPNKLDPISVEYTNWEISNLEESEQEDKYDLGQGYEKVEKNENIESRSTDENGNTLPEVDLNLNIPFGESTTVKVKCKAGLVDEKTKIENTATVTGDYIVSKNSNTVSHIILPYDYVENSSDPTNPEDPDNPNNPDKEDNGKNDSTKHSISGVAWVDENQDGERQNSEQLLSGIEVILVDSNNSSAIQQRKTTSNNGEYKFSDLEKGNYIVVFNYDTNAYSLTEYKKSGVSTSLNSDAMSKEITLLGNKTKVGITDIISLDASVNDIDIGLIKNKICDLKLDKYISKVTVNTSSGTKEQTYNQSQLAKVEIKSKEIQGALVVVEYKIIITNEGEIPATASKVVDYIPSGLEFSSELNNDWSMSRTGELINTSLSGQKIEPGKSAELTLLLTKYMNSNSTGTFTNIAEIGEVNNSLDIKDTDSIPGNKSQSEDDYSKADLIISVSTGIVTYIFIITVILIIIGFIIFLNFKFGFKKISKISMFVFVSIITVVLNTNMSFGYAKWSSLPTWDYWYETGSTYEGYAAFESYDGIEGSCAMGTFDSSTKSGDARKLDNKDGDGGKFATIRVGNGSNTSEEIKFNKENTDNDILVTKNGSNLDIGPFKTSGNVTSYSYEIIGENRTYTNPTRVNQTTTKGITSFYLRIPDKGDSIKTIKITGYKNVKITSKVYYAAYGYYIPYEGNTTGNMTVEHDCRLGHTHYDWPATSYYHGYAIQDIYTDDRYMWEEESTTTRNENKALTWVVKNGDLEVTKVDEDNTSIVMPGVKIRIYCTATGYDQTFTTDENGKITIKDLRQGNYTIQELSNDYYGYYVMKTDTIQLRPGMTNKFSLKNTKYTGNLVIQKKDPDVDKTISGVGFRIKRTGNDDNFNGYVKIKNDTGKVDTITGQIHVDDTNMEYVENIDDATKFITDENGRIEINNILKGWYEVEEVDVGKAKEGEYYAYELDENYISWEYTSTGNKDDHSSTGKIAKIQVHLRNSKNTLETPQTDGIDDIVTFKNKKKYTKIKGYAFEDIGEGKDLVKDNLYKEGNDKRIPEVKVQLYKEGTLLAETTTDKNGEYLFENYTDEQGMVHKIEIDQLKNMNIQFVYNGMIYETTDIVENNGTIKDESGHVKESTSGRKQFNENYNTIDDKSDLKYSTSNHISKLKYTDNENEDVDNPPVSNVKDQFKVTANTIDAHSSKTYEEGKPYILSLNMTEDEIRQKLGETEDTIENINLGLRKREQPDLAIMKDLYNVTLSINGKAHTYGYNQRNNKNNQDVYIKEQFDKIYAGQQRYRIDKNANGNVIYKEDNEGDYIYDKEKNEYVYIGLFNVGVKFGEKYGSMSYSRAVYESDYVYDDGTQEKNNNLKVYVIYQIKMKNQANTLNATVNSIVDYYDSRYKLLKVGTKLDENEDISEDGKIDYKEPDNPNKIGNYKEAIINLNTNIEAQKDSDIYVKFELDRSNYNINKESGDILDNVVEINSYTTTLNGEAYGGVDKDSKPGNAIPGDKSTYEDDTDAAPTFKLEYAKGPRTISGIVFLDESYLENNERRGSGEYEVGEKGIEGVKVVLTENPGSGRKYEAETGPDGIFKISGFIPGDYTLTYTWGDETYTVQDYKGTIVKPEIWESNSKNDKWYKTENPRYSDAIDEYSLREEIDAGDENGPMISTTPNMNFEIEKTDGTFTSYAEENKETDNGKIESIFTYDISNIDFGIVERAKQVVQIDKRVKNIKLALANDQTLIDTDVVYNRETKQYEFTNKDVKGLTYIPGAPGKIKAELDNELVQGAKLYLTYEITLKNISEKDYESKEYYLYGTDKDENKIIKLELKNVYDYFDNELSFDTNSSNEWKVQTLIDYNKENDGSTMYEESQAKDNNEETSSIRELKLKDKGILKLENMENKELLPENQIVISDELVFSKVLATADEIDLFNDSEITKVIQKTNDPESEKRLKGKQLSLSSKVYASSEEVVITPPTGKTDNTIEIILISMSALIIIGTGIIFIKKKVLK